MMLDEFEAHFGDRGHSSNWLANFTAAVKAVEADDAYPANGDPLNNIVDAYHLRLDD
ncbi:hypothetical protein [Corynebacterium suedekumii]|uniref:Uncharacterized protein n=1 Tax=Corynebacterium suedekumii TaxID=3049801 RepID=A0ABY8VIF2_9CORY|nr:hypothetical protein [Corynebacterium suedekumii]WIM69117.1 hypothetical protein QP029_07350 [Corynebacterium suedekumii]